MIIHHQMLTMAVLLRALIASHMALAALQLTTLPPSSAVAATAEDGDASSHWSVYQQQFNLDSTQPYNLPSPSPFRLSEAFESSASEHRRTERKLSGYSYSTLQQGEVAESFHHFAELNPHARSINAELEKAFATAATYQQQNDQSSLPEAELTASTNDLNVDQSPTGGSGSDGGGDDSDGIVPFDWQHYFTMDSQQLPSPAQQPQQPQVSPLESSADEVYQAKRSREEELNKS